MLSHQQPAWLILAENLDLNSFYIPRTLRVEDRTMPEAELLAGPGVAIILAEPGAGKTDLLDSVASRLGVSRVRASVFGPSTVGATLIVDAFDEVARIGDARLNYILLTIRDADPDRALLSSRSGEWENARTRLVRDLFGREPMVAHLVPLDDGEQRRLFEHLHPNRSFDAFHADIRRFDLHHLMGNPEFLTLFAGAYDESGGRLPSREHVFTLAVENLAREANPDVSPRGTPSRDKRISWANEVFACLLLSGAEGLAVGDVAEDEHHPQLATIGLEGDGPSFILSTKLFRPGPAADQHEPVHRIVAEHGAARALVGRIDDPFYRLTVGQCLALVAPNGAVRDDLRGLLGWMAALGSQAVQDAAIELDPYAVLSNGDPSRLTTRSRARLLEALRRLNADDPYFRRSDQWRSFSASEFFTADIVDAVRPILGVSDVGHLRGLLLELLVGSPAVPRLRAELQAILLDPEVDVGPRLSALLCLLNDTSFDPTSCLDGLIGIGDAAALRLASEIFLHMGEHAPYAFLRRALQTAAALYPTDGDHRSNVIGERYFLRPLAKEIDPQTTARLLDDLTTGLRCKCDQRRHACHCRDGISKIVGLLLDSYFERTPGPYDPDRIWGWMRNLHFHRQMDANRSPAVAALQADDTLRRALHERAFEGLTRREDIFKVRLDVVDQYGHSGLNLSAVDVRHLVDLAYQNDNPSLWGFFAPAYHFHAKPEERGSDELRRHCRKQAREKPELMREWARMNRARRKIRKEQRPRRYRFESRRRRRKRRVTEANTAFFYNNRAAVERGDNVQWTYNVAEAYLIQPDKLPKVTHGLFDPEAVLRSSLDTLHDRCPSVEEVGQEGATTLLPIFLAGALAEFRAAGTLEAVAPEIILAIFANTDGYSAFEEREREAFLAEARRWILQTDEERETYARAYLEPSLSASASWSDVRILDREPQLNYLRSSLPIEWLRRYPELPVRTLEALFDMAARYGNRLPLLALIRERCRDLDEGLLPHRHEEQRPFWFLRDFWFATEVDENVWAYMARDPNVVLWLENRRDRFRERDDVWMPLSAPKIERILLTYLPHWPVVPLPSSWGTESPKGETAYRYLREIVWQLGRHNPSVALPVVERLHAEAITAPSHDDLRSIRADLRRRAALSSSRPTPGEIAASLDAGPPASVEQLRALTLELLKELQKDIRAGHTGMIDQFYDDGRRLDEASAMYRVSAWMQPRLNPFGIHDVVEHQLGDRNRCDLTATRVMNGRPRMLVIEGKGQWHRDLFTAAKAQLADRYAMHPDADEQGIFLVFWYSPEEVVAGSRRHDYSSAADLKQALEDELPKELTGRIDVVLLDVSRRN